MRARKLIPGIIGSAHSRLFRQHVVFGEVVDGMNVVKVVEKLGTSSGRTNGTIKIFDCGRL